MSVRKPPRASPAGNPGGDDVLARRIRSVGQFLGYVAKRGNGLIAATQAMAKNSDPYLMNKPLNHELGQWLATQVAKLLRPDQRIHLRGLHYRLVSVGSVIKPDGQLYENSNEDWTWLNRKVAGPARWLGYVPFNRIVDEKNEPPRIFDVVDEGGNTVLWRPRRAVLGSGSGIYVPDLDNLLPDVRFDDGGTPRQPFRIVMIGEKTSLIEELEPIARRHAAELLMPSGDLSNSHLYEMAWRAVRDGRPLVVQYYSDFDCSGFNMPACVARKLQALIDQEFHELKLHGVYAVALNCQQCIDHDLPESFIKEGDKRKDAWVAKWGREQTEIDALAALRPGVLRSIALEALKPFHDDTLARRQEELEEQYEAAVSEWLQQREIGETAARAITEIEAYRKQIERATAGLEAAQERATDAMHAAINGDPDFPADFDLGPAQPVLAPAPDPIFSSPHGRPSDDEWIAATRKLQERRSLIGEDDGE
jgi:hypothetical protein